jgi:hypothetical protein
MNKVEIHGMGKLSARRLRRKIFEILYDQIIDNDLVVSIFPTDVRDKTLSPQPFLRLVNSGQKNTNLIILRLLRLGLDVEHIKREGYYPRGQ